MPVKRPLALLSAVVVLVLAWLGSRAVETNRAHAVKREAARGAETAGMRAAEALAAHVRELKLEAQNAAANPRLVAALRGNADAATLQDLFRTEEWWEPYRNAFRVYAVAFESDKLDVIEGMKTADFASDLIIREARERKEAVAEVVMGKGWPYAAAAAGVELPGRPIPAVLVLAKPIDDAAVRKLAEKARGAVLLSDGTPRRHRGGRRTPSASCCARRSARRRAGRSSRARTAPGRLPSASWCPACGSGRSRAAPPPRTRPRAPRPRRRPGSGSAAGLVALLALVIGLRRKPAAPVGRDR